MEEYTPNELLRPFIKTYKIIESQDHLINRVLPNTSFAIAFRLKGEISYLNDCGKTVLAAATFSGLRKSVRLIHYAPFTAALIVQFQEKGVAAFFKTRLHELFEESVSLDNFFPASEISIVEDRIAEAITNPAKIAIVERFLCSKLRFDKTDLLVSEAINRIQATHGVVKISELAKTLYISNDALEKRFRKVVGASPKQFSSIVKLKNIIDQKSTPISFLDAALEHGYYDQPHFNRDFKLFTGQTPTDFFKSGRYW